MGLVILITPSLYSRLTTGRTVRDRILVGTRFSARPDRPWGPHSLLHNGYLVFPGGKLRTGRAAGHSPPSNGAVMEEQSYISTHALGHTGPVRVSLYLLPLHSGKQLLGTTQWYRYISFSKFIAPTGNQPTLSRSSSP